MPLTVTLTKPDIYQGYLRLLLSEHFSSLGRNSRCGTAGVLGLVCGYSGRWYAFFLGAERRIMIFAGGHLCHYPRWVYCSCNGILGKGKGTNHIALSGRTFVEILFRSAQSPNPLRAHGFVAVLKKKAPHPRNPRSYPPFITADPHSSLLVKLIHLSHTTA